MEALKFGARILQNEIEAMEPDAVSASGNVDMVCQFSANILLSPRSTIGDYRTARGIVRAITDKLGEKDNHSCSTPADMHG